MSPTLPASLSTPIFPRPIKHEWATAVFSADALGANSFFMVVDSIFTSPTLVVAGYNRFALSWELLADFEADFFWQAHDPATGVILPFTIPSATQFAFDSVISPVTVRKVSPFGRTHPAAIAGTDVVYAMGSVRVDITAAPFDTALTMSLFCGVY